MFVHGLLCLASTIEGCTIYHTESVYLAGDAASAGDVSDSVETFLVDSGASVHCCSKAELFTSFTEHHPKKRVRVANGSFVPVHAIGDVSIYCVDQHGITREIVLRGVFFCPDLHCNLISTKRLWKDNRIKSSLTDSCTLKDKSGGASDGCKYSLPSNGRQYSLHSRKRASLRKSLVISALAIEGLPAQKPDDIFPVPVDVLHARLGHTSATRIRRAFHVGIGVPSVPFDKLSELECDGCALGGSRKPHFHSRPAKFKFTKWGQRIHSDLCGPFPADVHGNIYALCFVDSLSGHADVVFLKNKLAESVRAAFEEFLRRHKPHLPAEPEWFTDNGGEFISKDLNDFCEEFAVKRAYSIPYTPPQNGKAERLWGICLRGTRIALAHSGMPEVFWSYAMLDALWLHNHLPSRGNEQFLSPLETAFGAKPDFTKKRVWGCKCYFHLSDYDHVKLGLSKVSPTAVEAVNLGFDPVRNGYRVFIPSLNRITSAYKPKFRENNFLRLDHSGQRVPDVLDYDDLPAHLQQTRSTVRNPRATRIPQLSDDSGQPDAQANTEPQPQNATTQPTPAALPPSLNPAHGTTSTRTQRGQWNENHCSDAACTLPYGHHGLHSYERNLPPRRHPVHFVDGFDGSCADHCVFSACHFTEDQKEAEFWVLKTTISGAIKIPKTYEEALASLQADLWLEAMKKEIRDLLLHETWDADVLVPPGRKVTKSRWVFDVKYNRDGTVDRFKARFVVCGYSQIQGFDYDRAFSATLRGSSFRTLVAQASAHKLKLEQLDVTNAFTQAPIDDVDIYVDPPPGFGNKPIKLKKALYGTKQASRLWQQTLKAWLVDPKQGFVQSETEPCLYSKSDGQGRHLIVAVYVDDLVVAHNDEVLFTKFKEGFLKHFRAKYLGPLSWFLGVAVDRDSKGVYHIHQTKYINDLVARFGKHANGRRMDHGVPMTSDAAGKMKTAADELERARMKQLPYLQLVGSLLYLAVMTRPDLMASMSLLCKYMSDPSESCFDAALSVLSYVERTKDLEIVYGSRAQHQKAFSPELCHSIDKNSGLHAFSDSSWGRAFPLHGYVVMLAGGPVAYQSRALKIVADSSAEAEYAACSGCAKELIFVRELCRDMGFEVQGAIVMGVDNTAAIDIAKDEGVTKRNKHFERALHYIRKQVNMLRVIPHYVSTDLQTADIFTKMLDIRIFMQHRRYMFGR